MQRITRSLVSGLIAAACLWPAAEAAHAQDAAPTQPLLSVDQVRGAFANSGYQVDQAYNWDWTSLPVTTFQVLDPGTNRMLMVMVYPSATAALAARLEADTHEQAVHAGAPVIDGVGPHLISGYGSSVWNDNRAGPDD